MALSNIIPQREVLIPETKYAIMTFFQDLGNISRLVPGASVPRQSLEVPYLIMDQDLSNIDTERAEGADPKVIQTSISYAPIRLIPHALKERIDMDRENQNITLNGDLSYIYVVNNLVHALSSSIHKALLTNINDPANYDGVGVGEQPVVTQWINPAATPKADFKLCLNMFRKRQGAEPSTIAISRDVLDALELTTEWLTYWNNKTVAGITMENRLSEYFNYRGEWVILDTYRGINNNFTYYYSGVFLMATVEAAGSGQLIGDIVANRSAMRFYFLDQNADERNPEVRARWNVDGLGITDRQIIRIWDWYPTPYIHEIHSECKWGLHVPNKYGLAKLTNLL